MRAGGVAVLGCLSLVFAACGTTGRDQPLSTKPLKISITKLRGSVVRVSSRSGYAPFELRLRATVCVRPRREIYPDVIVKQFAVSRSRKRWDLVRSVLDRPSWLVPLQETWHGSCGRFRARDIIPSVYLDAVSLGNPNSCYGVALTLKAGKRRASKRSVVQCGGVHASRPGQSG